MVRTYWCGAGAASLILGFLIPGAAFAQNGSNYHVLTNGTDAAFFGVGAGGTQTAADGIGTFIAGEDLRGSHLTALGDFGFRMPSFTEDACVLTAPAGGGALAVKFAALAFVELDGLNGNAPANFTNPACTVPSFPLGGSGGFIPYGTGPGSTASFVLTGLPSGALASVSIFLPNNGLVPSA